MYLPTTKSPNVMETFDHRKNRRIRRNFPVKLLMKGIDNLSIEGMTVNLSQGGAFIKVNTDSFFKLTPRLFSLFFSRLISPARTRP
jgi:hypothetical protein